MSAPIVEVVKNLDCEIGEGPHWDHESQTFLFVDIKKSAVYRWHPDIKQMKTIYCPDTTVGAVVPRKGGGLVIAAAHRFAFLDEETSETETIAQVQLDIPNSRFNDGKCDPAGRFWAGTMGLESAPGVLAADLGALYRLDVDRKVTTQVKPVTLSNGLAWSPDNTVMYYIDSLEQCVEAFDYDITTGDISNQRVLSKFDRKTDGIPDGHCIDSEGNLWVAMYYGSQIIKVDTKTGQHVQKVKVHDSAPRITSVCFGGKNMDEMYVTSGRNKPVHEVEGGDISGALFKILNLGVKGLHANVYEG